MVKARHRQEQTRWSILILLGSVSCMVAVLAAAPAPSQSSSGLTAEDKLLLESGELVMKPKNKQQGGLKLFGGQSWQVVDVPVDAAWRAISDLPNYKSIIPLATESIVKDQDGNEADLAIRQQWGPVDIKYVLQTTLDSDRRVMMFRLDHSQGHDVRAGWGFLRVRPWKSDQTLVSFGAMVDIGDGVFVSIIRPAVRKDLLRIPTNLKHVAEGNGGERHRRSP